jgi:hypothetical protein
VLAIFVQASTELAAGAFDKTFEVVFSQNHAGADAWAFSRERKDVFPVF